MQRPPVPVCSWKPSNLQERKENVTVQKRFKQPMGILFIFSKPNFWANALMEDNETVLYLKLGLSRKIYEV